MFTRVSGKMIKLMEEVSIITQMELSIKENGRKISNMALAKRIGLMVQSMKDDTNWGKRKGWGTLNGQMEVPTRENSMITTSTERDSINGLIREHLQVIGSSIKCMVLEFSPGLMEENTKGNIMMIKNRGKGSLFGLMGENMMGVGMMASSMGLEHITLQRMKSNMESGKMERESSGFRKAKCLCDKRNIKYF